MVVEPQSLCRITGRIAGARDGLTWAGEFARLPALKAVVRDDGAGGVLDVSEIDRLCGEERPQLLSQGIGPEPADQRGRRAELG